MIQTFKIKKRIALMLDLIYINSIMHYLQAKIFSPFIRAINYHDVPAQEAGQFEEQLRYYAKHFSPISYQDLIHFHQGNWESNKPGLIISFDDGFRSASEVVAPLLEKYGFTGWFFIPPGLIDMPVNIQPEEAAKHRVFPKSQTYKDQRIFLTWEQIIELDKKHVVGCHTASHCRLKSTLTTKQLFDEVIDSKKVLENKLQHSVQVFAWVGGEEMSYSREAAKTIRNANYEIVFLTNNLLIRPSTDSHLLNRTNIESDFSPALMRFQLSGILDIIYTFKRRRVVSLVAG
jgi:peptidoglycan/xylan/chitin deacetylase (PgdA/CDA1 family)